MIIYSNLFLSTFLIVLLIWRLENRKYVFEYYDSNQVLEPIEYLNDILKWYFLHLIGMIKVIENTPKKWIIVNKIIIDSFRQEWNSISS